MKRRITILIALILAIGLGIIVTGTGSAQDPTPSDDDVNRIAKQLYCPVCENVSLDVCQTTACVQWRELIRGKLADGWTDQQIKDYFALQYGDRVLPAPPLRGFNWLFYVVPPLALIAGGVILYYIFRNMRRPRAKAAEPVPGPEPGNNGPEADPYTQRLEEELRRRQ